METWRLLPIPALNDNYVWLLADDRGNALVVDPGEAGPVAATLAREHLRLRAILLTHHHPDHIGGVEALRENGDIDVHAPRDPRIGVATHRVEDGDEIVIGEPALRFSVIAVPGHTRSHVAYHGHGLLFSGDTLFSVGCGRLFEGTPAQMLESLERLAALPADTQVCCGHEYTVANCAFAMGVDPGNAALRRRARNAQASRTAGLPTVPSLLGEELACNPFLRIDTPALIDSLAAQLPAGADRIERFAALRRLKDAFQA
ncbi:MAG TPA: hydroxyacylglutathione hydrolase [Dokdonella sp.]|nr:hydroxyacylglutathione hydrolase [Dokdonella sp.]